MTGRIVLITGATGGVGQIVTEKWLEAGAQVVAIGSERSLAELPPHARLATLPLDLTDEAAGAKMVAFARERFGEPDTLIHLMGGFTMGEVASEEALTQWHRMMALNATSALIALHALAPVFKQNGKGWAVGLSSRVVLAPTRSLAAYAASKAALNALFAAASDELKSDGVHINMIITSTVDTPANRAAMGEAAADKWVKPEQIAEATLYLCSPQAAATHGATLELFGRV